MKMNISAVFPAGVTEIVAHGLHQWDYGRILQIEAEGLPGLVEVHFACPGMREAVVRSCSSVAGVVYAAIPDQCLEQTSPVVAWVYEQEASAGRTFLTVTMPITARAKPAPSETVPEEISDKYTEAVEAMNEQLASVEALLEHVGIELVDAVFDEAPGVVDDPRDGDLILASGGEGHEGSCVKYPMAFLASYIRTKLGLLLTDEIITLRNAAEKLGLDVDTYITTRHMKKTAFDVNGYQTYTEGQVINPGVYMVIDGDVSLIVDTKARHSATYIREPVSGTWCVYFLRFEASGDGYKIRRLKAYETDTTDINPVYDNFGTTTGLKYRMIQGYPVG